jgi:uncharacterized protein (DUF2384 family)
MIHAIIMLISLNKKKCEELKAIFEVAWKNYVCVGGLKNIEEKFEISRKCYQSRKYKRNCKELRERLPRIVIIVAEALDLFPLPHI